MAYPGYVAIGLEDMRDSPASYSFEIVNNIRAFTYANAGGALPWLLECDVCPDIDAVVPDGDGYGQVDRDPAPWYTPRHIDSAGFYGVIGLELSGADDSTRAAKVSQAFHGGAIGRTYQQPRTMVLRALAVADAECSLSYGLRWLAQSFIDVGDPCLGSPLTFFECCPDANCDEGGDFPVGPCWPDTYAQLRSGPSCGPDWWPTTYGQLKAGPPYLQTWGGSGDWCDWVGVYREMRDWLPPWNCCHELRVIPRMKQFANARVTEGPIVLSRPRMSNGAMAEIEFTIVAGDPTTTRPLYYWPETFLTGELGPA